MRGAPWQLLLMVAGAACARSPLVPTPLVDDRASLRHTIDSMLAAPETRSARWGVLIVDPVRGDTLYSHDAGKLLVPASNQKILTAAVALDALGPEYRYATPFIAGGAIRGGVLEGHLFVQGRGDPTISDHLAGDAMLPLQAAADSLAARGITRIRGGLLAFGNAFPDAHIGHAWEHDDLATSSGAAIDELLFNEGIAQVIVVAGATAGGTVAARTAPARSFPRLRVLATTTDSVGPDSVARLTAVKDTASGAVVVAGTIPQGDTATLTVAFRDPSEAYLAALREALSDRGIVVEDSAIVSNAPPMDTLFIMRSIPLSGILAAFLKPSQNQIGEVLFKTVALARTDTGTARVARRVFGERLRAWGVTEDGFLMWDGSGLSRQDLVSPETLIRVLETMRRHPHFQTFYDAFPVAGVDGTLRTRMRGTAAEANARGKTGTLSNVRSLSGYVTTADGRLLLYSILSNNYLVPTAYISRVQDTIAVRLARLRGSWVPRGGVN